MTSGNTSSRAIRSDLVRRRAKFLACLSSLLLIAGGAESMGSDPSGSSKSAGAKSRPAAGLDRARNLPADDRIAFFMGQDSTTLAEFESSVLDNDEESDFPMPSGLTLYAGILPVEVHPNSAPEDATLYVSGIEGPPYDQSAGDVNFQATLDAYDAQNGGAPVALAVGLHLSDSWNGCINQPLRAINDTGDPDVGDASAPDSMAYQWRYAIDRMIEWFDQQDRPVFLRIGYEFDGIWNCYNQELYIGAFRYIKQRIDDLGAARVATVWQAATFPDDGDPAYHFDPSGGAEESDQARAIQDHYADWYPGSEHVDWIGISFFSGAQYLQYQWTCQDESKPWTVPEVSPRRLQDGLAEFARRHGKPLMIAESAPQGFNVSERTWSCVSERKDHLPGYRFADGDEMWRAFYADYFAWIEQNRDVVRVFAYINTNWQSQTRWTCAPRSDACPEGYWGDHRVQADADLLARFKAKVQADLYRVNGFMVGTATDRLPSDDAAQD